ncbi:MAG: TolB family protein [Planctomycetota bacterium]
MQQFSIRVGTALALLCGTIPAQTTSLVSRSGLSDWNIQSLRPSISADGRFVAFESTASDLVANDLNNFRDIFVYDRRTGLTTLASRSSSGVQANERSSAPSISADGRFVAFESLADNLVPVDSNALSDVFVHDRLTGATVLASRSSAGVQGNNWSNAPSISGNGRWVAFASAASSFVPNDPSGIPDVYLHDLQTSTTEFVSMSSTGVHGDFGGHSPSLSFDGRFVAFTSWSTNLVGGDGNGELDVFVRDRLNGTTELVSRSSLGVQGNDDSIDPSISADGRFVAFSSISVNLIQSDANGALTDVFLRDRQLGTTRLVSTDSNGVQGNIHALRPSISADGGSIAFDSNSTNLIPNDANGNDFDVYVHHWQSGTTELVSQSSDGVQGDSDSSTPSISGDGRFVAFHGDASNLVPGDGVILEFDIFLRDAAPSLSTYCAGDGSSGPCPCGNAGAAGHGCENSASTGGAILAFAGAAKLSADTLVLTSSGELPSALSIVLQGDVPIAPTIYGDGLRCVGGALKRLYVRNAVGGVLTAPQGADPTISERSMALGSAIPAGASRYYQTYYRDGNGTFCPSPPGNTWNVSNGIEAVWGY